jgi:hypothetical protein
MKPSRKRSGGEIDYDYSKTPNMLKGIGNKTDKDTTMIRQ